MEKSRSLIVINIRRINIKVFLTSIFFSLVLFGCLPSLALAASLYFSPSPGSYTVGQNFSIGVYVSSPSQAINAASGVISFPKDKLEVVSLSKNGSIFDLWVQEPSFFNTLGTINFEGIALNPGFTGTNGKIISITFKAKTVGNVPLSFFSGSALANDGSGTNILSNLGTANFIIGDSPTIPESVVDTSLTPKIFSQTHPDSEKWYNNSNPKFTWSLPADIIEIKTLYDRYPASRPIISYTPPISEKELANFENGVWYFHLQFRNISGWGGIAHFRFQIDTENPDYFEIKEVEREDLTDPKAKFIFDAKDRVSGIDYFEIKINDDKPQNWRGDKNTIYEMPVLPHGKHIIIVKAVDKAGNFLTDSTEFVIEALESPKVIDFSKELTEGESIFVKGVTYPRSVVRMFLQNDKNGKIIDTEDRSDGNGNFLLTYEKRLSSGVYNFWLQVIDQRGAQSRPTDKMTIVIKRSALFYVGPWGIDSPTVFIFFIILIVILFAVVWHSRFRFFVFKDNIRKEVYEAEQALHKAFDALKENIQEQVKMLERARANRRLTEEEEKIIKQFKQNLDNAEKLVRKEIRDIEKKMK